MGEFVDDVARSVGFLSRIAVPQRFFFGFDGRMERAACAFPVAGLLIALPGAALTALLSVFDAAPLFSAFAVVALGVMTTGALHEDGLADTADGLGGGRDRMAALAIMKDSRIGTYGALALVLGTGLRVSALSAVLAQTSIAGTCAALLATAAFSRAAMVWHWHRLPPARADGVAASVGQPGKGALRTALFSGGAMGFLLLAVFVSIPAWLAALAAFGIAMTIFTGFVRRKIDGHTGDTIGATQQIVEIAVLAALALTV